MHSCCTGVQQECTPQEYSWSVLLLYRSTTGVGVQQEHRRVHSCCTGAKPESGSSPVCIPVGLQESVLVVCTVVHECNRGAPPRPAAPVRSGSSFWMVQSGWNCARKVDPLSLPIYMYVCMHACMYCIQLFPPLYIYVCIACIVCVCIRVCVSLDSLHAQVLDQHDGVVPLPTVNL